MAKGLCVAGLVVAVVLLLFFALDLAIGVPFKQASPMMDIAMLVAAAILGYASWNSFRDIKS